MNQWLADLAHTRWHLHDFYCLGACLFILHFAWLSPATLKRKNILGSLIIMTLLWPLTYAISIYQIMRFRRLRH